MKTFDVSGDTCAVIYKGHLTIYDICRNKLLWKIKKKSEPTKTKVLKISPNKKKIAWIQSTCQLLIIHIQSRTISEVQCHPQYPYESVLWSNDRRTFAAFSSLSVFIDIYSADQDSVSHIGRISGAEFDVHGCPIAEFSPDGCYFSAVSICNRGQSIAIYSIENSSCVYVQSLLVTDCYGVGGMLWCQDSASLLLWQANIELRLQLWTLDGRREHVLTADADPATNICLSKCGRMAAVHTADGRVRILDILTWQLGNMGVLVHCPMVHQSSARTRLKQCDHASGPINICEPVTSTLCELNHDPSRTTLVDLLQFSQDAQYLATYEPVYPNTVWVWNLTAEPPLDTLILLKSDTFVTELLWHHEKSMLAVSLNRNRVLVWTCQQAFTVDQSYHPWPLVAHTYFATLDDS